MISVCPPARSGGEERLGLRWTRMDGSVRSERTSFAFRRPGVGPWTGGIARRVTDGTEEGGN